MSDTLILTDSNGRKIEVTEDQFFAQIELFDIQYLTILKDKPYWLERYLRNMESAR